MTDGTFYFGLLYGLRAAGVGAFDSAGDDYHNAYGELMTVMKRAGGPHPGRRLFGYRDRMFGTYHEASETVVWGLHGVLLTLDSPRLVTARFTISARAAERWLSSEKHGVWFRQLGRVFADALEKRGAMAIRY